MAFIATKTGYSENEKANSVSHPLKDIINFKLPFQLQTDSY